MSLAFAVYGMPLLLDRTLCLAGRGMSHSGPMMSSERMMLMSASGLMTCLVILPLLGFILGLLGIYRQKKEIELSFLASLMHGTLLAAICMMLQNASDANTYMQIMQLAFTGVII